MSDFAKKLAEELCSVQPMSRDLQWIFDPTHPNWDLIPKYDGPEHTPGDGTFCECFGRCYVCHPETDEERAEREKRRPVEFKSITLPVIKGK